MLGLAQLKHLTVSLSIQYRKHRDKAKRFFFSSLDEWIEHWGMFTPTLLFLTMRISCAISSLTQNAEDLHTQKAISRSEERQKAIETKQNKESTGTLRA